MQQKPQITTCSIYICPVVGPIPPSIHPSILSLQSAVFQRWEKILVPLMLLLLGGLFLKISLFDDACIALSSWVGDDEELLLLWNFNDLWWRNLTPAPPLPAAPFVVDFLLFYNRCPFFLVFKCRWSVHLNRHLYHQKDVELEVSRRTCRKEDSKESK